MTYKRYGWLAGFCFFGMLISGGMTENGRIDLFSGAAIMLALLKVKDDQHERRTQAW